MQNHLVCRQSSDDTSHEELHLTDGDLRDLSRTLSYPTHVIVLCTT